MNDALSILDRRMWRHENVQVIIDIFNDNGLNLIDISKGLSKYRQEFQKDMVCFYDKPDRLMVYISVEADFVYFSCGYGGSVEINIMNNESVESISKVVSCLVGRRNNWKKENPKIK